MLRHAHQEPVMRRSASPSPAWAQAERDAEAAAWIGGPTTVFSPALTPSDVAECTALTPTTPGASLDGSTRRTMGARFGYDFARVRVHDDEEAASLAEKAHARAYTIGHDLVFARGQYAPDKAAGRRLLTHELSHVVQQASSGVRAVQRDDKHKPVQTPPADPELALGERLVKDFSNGIDVAFYQPMPSDKEAAMGAANAWAKREQALGVRGKAVTAKNARFGEAMSDADHPLVATVQALGTLLNSAVAKAAPGPQLPGTGPTTIKTLGIFAHGTSSWCGLGAVTSSKAATVIKSIAPTLASSVNVILFSCNSGRSPDESEEWVKGTMRPGGSKSLAAVTRDALITEGKAGGTVWGHTATGHVTENFALREFEATGGKGSEGASFAQRYAFGPNDMAVVAYDLVSGVTDGGYETVSEQKLNRAAVARAEREIYAGYAAANKALTYGGGKLAESAPTHPVEVGKMIKEYWDKTHWPAHKDKAVQAFVRAMLTAGLIKKRPPTTP
jgi:hypothetical protein